MAGNFLKNYSGSRRSPRTRDSRPLSRTLHANQASIIADLVYTRKVFPLQSPSDRRKRRTRLALSTTVRPLRCLGSAPEVNLSRLRAIPTKQVPAAACILNGLRTARHVLMKDQTKWRATGRSKKDFGQRFSWAPLAFCPLHFVQRRESAPLLDLVPHAQPLSFRIGPKAR